MTEPESIDPRQLRDALGAFATGITIVTTRDADGKDIGLTANSFNSVSLTPPMVLWSLAKSSLSQPAFAAAEFFAVHILAADQESVSNLFAKRGVDKFADLELERGQGEVPLLPGCAARFQCRTAFRYEGGDHDIFVGEVIDFEHFEKPPLIYHRGKYGLVAPKASGDPGRAADGSFSGNFLGFLLGEAHFRLFDGIRRELARLDISLDQYFALCALGLSDGRTTIEIDTMARFYDQAFPEISAGDLVARGLVGCEGEVRSTSRLHLTAKGRGLMIELLAIGKDAEARAQEDFDFSEAQLFRSLLKRLIKSSDRSLAADHDGPRPYSS